MRTAALFLLIFGAIPAAAMDEGRFQCPGSTRAVVISGGGVKGAYQIGALWYLVNVLGCDFLHYYGTSTGAATAGILSQARNHDELKAQVSLLLTQYRSLKKPGDIVDDRFAGKFRLLLPRWAGGVDAAGRLTPFERTLRAALGANPAARGTLFVTAVSLQAGPLDPAIYRVDDVIDMIVGSASIPLAIEPRPARVWVRATPVALDGDVVTLGIKGLSGLPDPKCEIRLSSSRVLKCLQLDAKSRAIPMTRRTRADSDIETGEPEFTFRTDARLRLVDPDAEDLALLAGLAQAAKGNFSSLRSPVEFSTRHQLVDGGVTENVPLMKAVKEISGREGVDTIFVLLAGRAPAVPLAPKVIHGGVAVAGAAFGLLWDSSQMAESRSPISAFRFGRFICSTIVEERRAVQWREDLERVLGREKMTEVEKKIGRPFPLEAGVLWDWIGDYCVEKRWKEWRIYEINPLQPEDSLDTLEVAPAKIRAAIVAGCVEAGAVVRASNEAVMKETCRPLEGE